MMGRVPLKMTKLHRTNDDESLSELPKAAASYGKTYDESLGCALRNDDSENEQSPHVRAVPTDQRKGCLVEMPLASIES